MEEEQTKKIEKSFLLDGFSPISSTKIGWKSRKRSSSASEKKRNDNNGDTKMTGEEEEAEEETTPISAPAGPTVELSERRKALFEPLTKLDRISSESLIPPPDFDAASYPRGWLVGKKRKLVNIDVVESMRRIAVQEMNRKDREIGELNDILDEDSKALQHVQTQLLEERAKSGNLERENQMLREQVKMLMGFLDEQEPEEDDDHHRHQLP